MSSPESTTPPAGSLSPLRPRAGARAAGAVDPAAGGDLAREVRHLHAKLDRFLALVTPLATRQLSREQQARKAGVHPTTLWRREQKAKAQLALLQVNTAHAPRRSA